MNELKTTFRRMAFYYLLMLINFIPNGNIIPDVFPLRNLSAVYLLTLCVCLIMYYSHRVTPSGALSFLIKAISWLMLMMILFRGIKYSVFAQVDVVDRHIWYLYYIPLLLIPLFLFFISLSVSSVRAFRVIWFAASAVTVLFILLIVTNDIHQRVFRFNPGFENWDGDYSYGLLFYVITVWRYVLYSAAFIILIIKCRISSSKRNAWIILIPFAVGIILNLLLITGYMPTPFGSNLIELPEVIIFTVAIVLECCMQLGLIPTNTDYGKLFRRFSISAQITNKKWTPVYSSSSAKPLTAEQFEMPDGSRIDEHTVLRKMGIPGGFGFWQDDMRELDRLNSELEGAREELAQEAELIRLRNELKEKQTITEQRTRVYDTIAERTLRQSEAISDLARTARLSSDAELKEKNRRRIAFLGAYIKRYANLVLLSQENNVIQTGELGLSVSEVLRYLNFCDIPGEFFGSALCAVPADAALGVFEAFELLLETNCSDLRGAFVNLSEQEENVVFKLTLENAPEGLSDMSGLSSAGVRSEVSREDDVAYFCFILPKGGEAV